MTLLIETERNKKDKLLQVSSPKCIVSGPLLKLALSENLINKINPHEKINQKKVKALRDHFETGESQKTPIIVGVIDEKFNLFLSECFNFAKIIKEEHTDKQKEVLYHLPEIYYTQIKKIIAATNTLILIDGHHRYFALLDLFKKNILPYLELNIWLVPFSHLRIDGFVKFFNYSDEAISNILKYIDKKYNKLEPIALPETLAPYEIRFFFNGYFYRQIVTTEEFFLLEMEFLSHIIDVAHLELITVKILEDNEPINGKYHPKEILLFHSTITHKMILNAVAQKKCFPVHSTCFNPKPSLKDLCDLS